jgi:hypothetical protein
LLNKLGTSPKIYFFISGQTIKTMSSIFAIDEQVFANFYYQQAKIPEPN